ncbi:hypothetical protein D7X33_07340 [Butyricicoccus sp. 1XD8-22]|nr:hypothetical protein D7X33_07340 [Butyricicoccus sp. 1XD8-22]
MAQKPNHVCAMCNKPYYCCEASLKLSSKMYVYKTQFCSPECYGRYLEVKEAQRAAKEAPATAGTAETAPERTEPQIPKGSRNRKKAAEEPAERPSEALF